MTDIEIYTKLMEPLRGFVNVKDGVLNAILCGATRMTDDDLEAFPALDSVGLLEIDETAVTDRGLACLAKYPKLDTLLVGRTVVSGKGIPDSTLGTLVALKLSGCSGVTDDSLVFLVKCKSLKTLHLDGTAITDAALEHVAKAASLRSLYLERTEISDDGLPFLRSLKGLTHVDLTWTRATAEGWLSLKEHLPALIPSYRLKDTRAEFREQSKKEYGRR